MCGRFTLTADWGLVREWFFIELAERMERIAPRYNVGPGQDVLAIVGDGEGRRRAGMLRWGLQPTWVGPDGKKPAPLMNARAESLAAKPTFRGLLARRRCLVPADGFYEWKRGADGKNRPMRAVLTERPLFSFAALYDTYVDESGARHHSCVIVTTEPNRTMAEVHDRMPAILRREDEALWLDRSTTDAAALLPLLRPYDDAAMRLYPVSPDVGNVRWDVPACIDPWTEPAETPASEAPPTEGTLF
ncbi:SOS response-associated peptidase [Paenibacillus sp. TRM 82003]|nr:SOS response-associated peptidase [Paenibacillus sp. TRM 82003]